MNNDENDQKRMKQMMIYVTIPFVLAIPPVIGWLIGTWLDTKLDTKPYFMYFLIFLGFISGFRELYRMLKRFGNEP